MSEKNKTLHVVEGVGEAIITLSRKAKANGVEVETLKMREPTVGDQERAQESTSSDTATEVQLFASLCQVSPDDIRGLPLRDYKRLQSAYVLFTT